MFNDMIQQLLARMGSQQQQSQFPPVVGRAPPQQPLPGGTPPGQALQPFLAQGPYALQALRLAGLLSGAGGQQAGPGLPTPNVPTPGVPLRPIGGSPYVPGMFMPGYRTGIDQPIRGSMPQGRRPVRVV